MLVAIGNHPPSLSGTPPAFALTTEPYSFQLTAGDLNGDTITFTDNLSLWATLDVSDPGLPTVTGTPATSDVGLTTATTTENDGIDTTELTCSLSVRRANTVVLTWDNPTTNTDGSTLDSNDINGYEVTYSRNGGTPTVDRFVTGPGGGVTWTSPSLDPGHYTFTIRVFDTSDTDGLSSSTANTLF